MPCYHPIDVGVPKDSVRAGGPKIWTKQTVPCGHCLGCRANQAQEWSLRIMHETQMHDQAWFLTLTYNNERMPPNGSLNPSHIRTFFKDLRRDQPPKTVSYYACGEYGDNTQRPHYHAVLYGPDFLDRIIHRDDPHNPAWRSATLERYWTHGLCEFGLVTPGSARYVAGYVRKKLTKRQDPTAYDRVDPSTGELVTIHPEFSRMSRRPAIGKRWIEKYWRDVYPKDFVTMDGKRYKPPRFYDKWMDQHHPRMMFEVRLKRDKEAKHLAEEKLQAKEKIHKSRDALYSARNKI